VGIHPHEASLANAAADAQMLQWAQNPKVIAWGEIGLDYFYDHSPRETQKTVFLQQMELAQTAKLPIIIHCRPSDNSENAWDDCLALIAEHWSASGLGGILHCFTGSVEHASRALDLGFMISFVSYYQDTNSLVNFLLMIKNYYLSLLKCLSGLNLNLRIILFLLIIN